MNKLVTVSIKSFISELEERIALLSSTKITENIDSSNYDKINSLLSRFTSKSPESVEISDLKQINKENLEKLLILIGENPDSIEFILSKLDSKDNNEYYDRIKEHLLSYVVEYRNYDKNQSSMINDKVTLYQKYIRLFNQRSFIEPFTEINELSKVMTEIGFPDEDKWRILGYIAEKNNETIYEKDLDLTVLVNNANESVIQVIDNLEILKKVKKELEPMTIDIDLIPTIATDLAPKVDLDVRITTNLVASVVAANMLTTFERMDNPEDEMQMRELILEVLDYIEPIHDEVVYQAREIKEKAEDLLITSKLNGVDDEEIKRYIDVPITILEEETESREEAIDLKKLPVIQSLVQTLETLDNTKMNTEEYKKGCAILERIVEQYIILEDKKEELKKKRNN